MLRIIKSLLVISVVAAVGVGATGAYFSDTATITGNTFATGKLEIRIDGMQTIHGMHFVNEYPSDIDNSVPYVISNSLFIGGSTLNAKTLQLSTTNVSGDPGLLAATKIKVEVKRLLGGSWQDAGTYPVGSLNNVDLIHAPLGLADLSPLEGIALRYKIGVPETGVNQNELMQKSISWDFAIEGRTN